MIKFDLHIHSIESAYKEDKHIVDNSTIDNAEVLMQNLNKYDVNLFSITDHNRFNIALYERLDSLIISNQFPNVKGIIAGIEFDVQIDSDMGKCHIITLFDAKNKMENYIKIYNVIEKSKLENRNDYYEREKYESILRDIGMDVILIACQRNGLEKHDGKHNSLSESTMDSEQLLMSGYISALEFQNHHVEGILRNNLKTIPKKVMLVMGSDCHDWTVYPNHDGSNTNTNFRHSRANILPTFKGLLMAVTSPETRINQQENINREYIHSFKIGDKEYLLANGMNAIIGENGAGKSTLLQLLYGDCKRYVKNLLDKNVMSCETIAPSKKFYIGQGDIIEKFNGNNLFPKDNFKPINHSKFCSIYNSFAEGILKYIRNKIKLNDMLNALSKEELQYNELINESTYFIQLVIESNYENVENIHGEYKSKIEELLSNISSMQNQEYFKKYGTILGEINNLLSKIYVDVNDNFRKVELENNIKNVIVSSINEYLLSIKEAASSKENDQSHYLKKKQAFISLIIDTLKKETSKNMFPELPQKVSSGVSKNLKSGFYFTSEANYNDKDVVNEFLSKMFNQKYADISMLKKINTIEELVEAIKGCAKQKDIDATYENNLSKF